MEEVGFPISVFAQHNASPGKSCTPHCIPCGRMDSVGVGTGRVGVTVMVQPSKVIVKHSQSCVAAALVEIRSLSDVSLIPPSQSPTVIGTRQSWSTCSPPQIPLSLHVAQILPPLQTNWVTSSVPFVNSPAASYTATLCKGLIVVGCCAILSFLLDDKASPPMSKRNKLFIVEVFLSK